MKVFTIATSFSANCLHVYGLRLYTLLCELLGIQDHLQTARKLPAVCYVGGIEVSYIPLHSYNILVITLILGFPSDLGNIVLLLGYNQSNLRIATVA